MPLTYSLSNRGFRSYTFKDNNGEDHKILESSNVELHLWLDEENIPIEKIFVLEAAVHKKYNLPNEDIQKIRNIFKHYIRFGRLPIENQENLWFTCPTCKKNWIPDDCSTHDSGLGIWKHEIFSFDTVKKVKCIECCTLNCPFKETKDFTNEPCVTCNLN